MFRTMASRNLAQESTGLSGVVEALLVVVGRDSRDSAAGHSLRDGWATAVVWAAARTGPRQRTLHRMVMLETGLPWVNSVERRRMALVGGLRFGCWRGDVDGGVSWDT